VFPLENLKIQFGAEVQTAGELSGKIALLSIAFYKKEMGWVHVEK